MAALIGFEFQGKSDPRHDIGPYPSLRHFPEKNLPSTQPVERLHLKKTSIPQEKPIKRGLKMLEAKNSISPHQKHQERVHLRPRDSEPPALEPVMERKNRDFSHFAMTLPRYSSLKNGEQQTRGRVPNLIDRRNGIDVKVLGDKQYHSVEFSPNFFVYSKQNKGGGGIALPSKLSKEEKNARRDKAAADARARRYGLAMPGEATLEPPDTGRSLGSTQVLAGRRRHAHTRSVRVDAARAKHLIRRGGSRGSSEDPNRLLLICVGQRVALERADLAKI